MTFSIKSTAGRSEGGAAGRGAEELPRPAAALRLIRATAASWTHEREQEAREAGYRLEIQHERGMLIASFFNGPFHCYDREHVL